MIRAYDEYGNIIDLVEWEKQIRETAIDDFVKFANDMPTVEEEDGEIRSMWLEEMAEQLKASANNKNKKNHIIKVERG